MAPPLTTTLKDSRVFALFAEPFRRLDVEPAESSRVALGSRAYWSKDILPVGTWHHVDWADPWDVTPEILEEIAANFRTAKARGVKIPVLMVDQSSPSQHHDIAKNEIGAVDSVYVDGDRLVADMWTNSETDSEVYQLDTKAREVSVDVRPSFLDGKGHTYGLFLKHVAVVTHPVVTGQGPFVRQLSSDPTNRNLKPKTKGKQMAKARQLADGAEGDAADQAWTLDEVKDLLSKFNITIPEEATTKEAVLAVAAALSGSTSSESKPAEEMPADSAAAIAENPAGSTPAQLASACRTLGRKLATQSRQLASQAAAELAARKTNYDTSLKRHVGRGAISEADRAEYLKTGEALGYQMSAISAFDKIPDNATVPLKGGQARQMATGNPPSTGDAGRASDDECKKAAQSFWGVRAKA